MPAVDGKLIKVLATFSPDSPEDTAVTLIMKEDVSGATVVGADTIDFSADYIARVADIADAVSVTLDL